MPHTLVPSDRVEGAPVYGSDGTKIGSIERLMLDKRTGMVAYAVVKTRGRFGAAYEADVTLEALRSGPSELDGEAFDWGDCSRPYRHPHYWGV